MVKNLIALPNYLGVVHRGLRGYKHSNNYKVGDVFNWKSFISTTIDARKSKAFLDRTGTLFHISCVTGKDITEFSVF
jgi:hypothetical protein